MLVHSGVFKKVVA